MNVPVSTAGLTPTQRCRDLAQRELFMNRRHPVGLQETMWERRITQFHKPGRGFESFGGFCSTDNSGSISVFQVGGGYHRDCRPREYEIRGGYVVSITRPRVDA